MPRTYAPRRARWIGGLLTAAALVALAGSIAAWSPRAAPARLRLVESVSISTLDPASMSILQDIRVAMQLFEGLMVFDPRGPTPRMGCAEDFTVDAAKTVYRFRIRDDARWSNGDAVTPEDFIFAWRRAIEPGTAQDYAFLIEYIVGAKEYVAWRRSEIERISRLPSDVRGAERDAHLAAADARFQETVHLRRLDPRMLEMRLSHPVAYWLDVLAAPVCLPLHAASVSRSRHVDDTGLIYYDPRWIKPGSTEFNGAYVLADWRFKRDLRLEKNPFYWDRERVRVESAEVLDVGDTNTAWLMYQAGAVDWLPSVEAGFTPELVATSNSPFETTLNHAAGGRSDVHAFGCFGTYFYSFNCLPTGSDGRPNPFADPRVRRALAQAVDRRSLCENVLRQGEAPATAFIPPGSIVDYPMVDSLPFDPDAARRELVAAGYRDRRKFPEVVISFNNEANHGLIAQTVAAMLRTHLGIRVRVAGKESQTFSAEKQNHDFMIARASWFGDYADPTTFLDTLLTGNGNNDSAFSDPAFDAMMRAAENETDRGRRLQLLADAERYVVGQALPILPLYHYVNVYAYRPDHIRGLAPHPRLLVLYKDLEVVP